MKTIKNIGLKLAVIMAVFMAVPAVGQAQVKKGYANVDWQFNVPLSNKFASTASGWGMNFEAGYFITDNIGVGLFLAYSTNNEYFGQKTLNISETAAMTTDQQHSLFQLPFGASSRYRFVPERQFIPYLSLKLGPEYSEMSSYYNVYKSHDYDWGFYISPEVGITMYPTQDKSVGFHVALYYSYATNKGNVLTYSLDGLNNFGFRLGLAF